MSEAGIKNLLCLSVSFGLVFGYLIIAQKLGRHRLSRLMNALMFLLLVALGSMVLVSAGGALLGTGLVKVVIASVVKKLPYVLFLGASSSLVFTMIALDFWKNPAVIIPNKLENIKYLTLIALSQNALLLTWLALNKYSLSNNFISIAAPIITTTIWYQNFYQYLPVYLQKISFSSLQKVFTQQAKKALYLATPHKQHEVSDELELRHCERCLRSHPKAPYAQGIAAPYEKHKAHNNKTEAYLERCLQSSPKENHGLPRPINSMGLVMTNTANQPTLSLINKYRHFWQNFSKNVLNLVNKETSPQSNKLLVLDFINLYNEQSNQAKIVSLESIIHKLRQHKINNLWLSAFDLILNFLQKFAPEINATSSQKMVSGLINLFQKLVTSVVDEDNTALFVTIKKITATLLKLNQQIKSNNNIEIYAKMHIYLAIQGIIKSLSSNKLYTKQSIESVNELIDGLELALSKQAKPDYFNINYANIIVNNRLDDIPISIKRLPDQKYQNDACAVFVVENIKIANKIYQVVLATKMDIRLYELDYLDWQVGLDFKDISITDQDGARIVSSANDASVNTLDCCANSARNDEIAPAGRVIATNDEYAQVLAFLKKLPKFLGRELIRLDAIATEVFATTDDLIPALGKIQELMVTPIINANSEILTEDFLNNLQDVTQKFSPIEAHNIINNYKNILLNSVKHNNSPDLGVQIQRMDDLLAQDVVLLDSSAKLQRA